MDLNPYEELGVPRDADEATIKKAYRAKSKQTHPDVEGGSEEAFARVSTSLAVLTDPEKRKTFDDTGRIDEGRPDNDRAAALQIIEMQIGALINDYITKGFAPQHDPRRMNIPKVIATKVRAEIPTATDAIQMGNNVLEFYRDMLKRFTVKPGAAESEDFISRQLKTQIEQTEQQIASLRVSIRVRELAIKIVEGYDFKMDSPYVAPESYSFDERPYGFPDHINRDGRGVWNR